MKTYRIAECLGDGISAELSRSVHRAAVYDEAVEAMTTLRTAIKYPTVTAEESPNRILRERWDFAVIHRPLMTFPIVENNFKQSLDIDVVRIATGGTYSDRGMRIGEESAVSNRVIERRPSRLAARYAFDLAREQAPGARADVGRTPRGTRACASSLAAAAPRPALRRRGQRVVGPCVLRVAAA